MNKTQLKKYGKTTYDGFVDTEIFHYIGIGIALLLAKTKITANQITLIWLAIQTCCSLIIMTGKYYLMVAGIIIWYSSMILDSVDGALARIKNLCSLKGIYLATFTHNFGSAFLFYAITMAVFKNTANIFYLIVGLTLVSVFLFCNLLSPKFLNIKPQPKDTKNNFVYWIKLFFRRQQPINIITISIIFKFPHLILFLYLFIYVGISIQKIRRNIKKFDGVSI